MVARLLKFNNEVVYEQLLTPQMPFALDYFEVVFSLCDIMCLIYAKFLEEVSGNDVVTTKNTFSTKICFIVRIVLIQTVGLSGTYLILICPLHTNSGSERRILIGPW